MNGKSILVVDDENVNHLLYTKMLKSCGWTNIIHSAFNGAQALEILEGQCRGELRIPDLILLDLHMPCMNGIEFITAMRQIECLKDRYQRIVIAVVSASMDPTDFEKARLLGVRHIFSKPLGLTQLELLRRIEFDNV
jgi:CheY-like chemotaxis protein